MRAMKKIATAADQLSDLYRNQHYWKYQTALEKFS